MPSKLMDPSYLELLKPSPGKAADFARQILATTASRLLRPFSELYVLDVGCGHGATALELARHCRHVVGLEPGRTLYESGLRLLAERPVGNIELRHARIEELDAEDRYDLVVLDNVFEHLPDQEAALTILSRALLPGGVMYILTPNKLWPVEAHYRLPFLGWLPLRWANAYLRLSGRGTDYTDASYAPTYGRIRRLFAAHPELRFSFVLPANLSLSYGGVPFHYRVGVALIRRFPSLWRISKSLLVLAWKE